MVASDFEYRHRFWMIVLVYVAAYAFYNVNHVNVLYAIVPWNRGVLPTDTLVRFLYAGAAFLAAGGALLLTWCVACRPPIANPQQTPFSIAGPFRYVRNPQYLSNFLLMLALGTFQSVIGFPVLLVGEAILLLRLVGREELRLGREYGERFLKYAERTPPTHGRRRPVPALGPSPLGAGLSVGLCRNTAGFRLHLERSRWLCLWRRDLRLLAIANACPDVLE
jgi:protein-S-isoprenylcysteine O-methyltransferase Ste14